MKKRNKKAWLNLKICGNRFVIVVLNVLTPTYVFLDGCLGSGHWRGVFSKPVIAIVARKLGFSSGELLISRNILRLFYFRFKRAQIFDSDFKVSFCTYWSTEGIWEDLKNESNHVRGQFVTGGRYLCLIDIWKVKSSNQIIIIFIPTLKFLTPDILMGNYQVKV